jgi:hypothetical protein
MIQTVDCRHCGAALSYGERFRHNLAREVAGGRQASKQILGDRLSPKNPQALCGACRSHAEEHAPEPVVAKQHPWLLPAAAAMVGLLLVATVLKAR